MPKASMLNTQALQKGKATDRYNAKNTRTVTGQDATAAAIPDSEKLEQKLFQIKWAARRQFDVLKGEQGPRSGPRLIAEALNLLFEKYGKPTIPVP
jgi:hypothetical protein